MELRHLRHFLAILETGSLNRAAKQLHISEPALSKSINRLEQFLHVRLMDRGPRGMVPTVFGDALAIHAKLVASELSAALDEMREIRGGAHSLVRLGVGPSLAAALPKVMEPMSRECPDTRLIVHEGLFNATVSAVVHDLVDFGIVPIQEDFDERDLEMEYLATDTICIVGRFDHPLLSIDDLTINHIKKANWIVPSRQDRAPIPFDNICANNGFTPIIVAESASLTFTLSCLRQSDALSFLPKVVTQVSDGRAFSAFPIKEFSRQRKRYILQHKRKSMSPASKVLIREIRKLYDEMT